MKFLNGQTVFIKAREDATSRMYPSYINDMLIFAGKSAVIKEGREVPDGFAYSLIGIPFTWNECWLEESKLLESELFEI